MKQKRAMAPSWLGIDEADELANYLSDKYPPKGKVGKKYVRTKLLVEAKCLRCHVHKTVFRTSYNEKQWLRTNKRMREKSPSWISVQQVRIISKFLSENFSKK